MIQTGPGGRDGLLPYCYLFARIAPSDERSVANGAREEEAASSGMGTPARRVVGSWVWNHICCRSFLVISAVLELLFLLYLPRRTT